MNRLIFIDGLPGSGKTVLMKKLKKQLGEEGIEVLCYGETGINPLDSSKYAFFTSKEYKDWLNNILFTYNYNANNKFIKKIINFSEFYGEYVIVPITPIVHNCDSPSVVSVLNNRDIHNRHIPFEKFHNINLLRWNRFSKQIVNNNKTYIFDGSLIQAPIFQLLGFYCMDVNNIEKYVGELIDSVRLFSPTLYYIDVKDVSKLVSNTIKIRSVFSPNWIKGFLRWVNLSPYCRAQGWDGIDGVVSFLEKRLSLDHTLLKHLKINIQIRQYKMELFEGE